MRTVAVGAFKLLLLLGFAVSSTAAAPPESVQAAAPAAEEIARLVEQLGASETAARDEAARRLSQIGEAARPQLEAALAGKPEFIRRRIDIILRGLDARAQRAETERHEARYRSFIAGGEASLPGWSDFYALLQQHEELAEPFCRRVFVTMHRAEPELLEVYQNGNREKAADLLESHFYAWQWQEQLQSAIGRNERIGLRTPVAAKFEAAKMQPISMLAFFFVAGDPQVKIDETLDMQLYGQQYQLKRAISQAARQSVMQVEKGPGQKQREKRNRTEIAQARTEALYAKLMIAFCKRPPQDKSKNTAEMRMHQRIHQRITLATTGNVKGELPFILAQLEKAWSWERHPTALIAIAKLGDRPHIDEVEPLLENREAKDFGKDYDPAKPFQTAEERQEYMESLPDVEVQARDLALVALLELTGQEPEDYGLTMTKFAKLFNRNPNFLAFGRPPYYFKTSAQRDKALARWHAWAKENLPAAQQTAPSAH